MSNVCGYFYLFLRGVTFKFLKPLIYLYFFFELMEIVLKKIHSKIYSYVPFIDENGFWLAKKVKRPFLHVITYLDYEFPVI